MFKRIRIFLLAGVIGAFCLELGEQIGIPGVPGFVSECRGQGWPSVNAGQRRRRRT